MLTVIITLVIKLLDILSCTGRAGQLISEPSIGKFRMSEAQNIDELQSSRIIHRARAINLSSQQINLSYNGATKRLLDIVLASLLLPLMLPTIAITAILSRFEGGSGFFGHIRVGRNGKYFKCWKIRTMVPDAQQRLADFIESNPDAKTEWETNRKLRKDPRITSIGGFLRETSLDELPQIWNVLKGDMSFVGPRPVTKEEMHFYGDCEFVYTSLRPGITGLWQVSGRNDVSYLERVRFDIDYFESISFTTDIKIIAKTVSVVFRRTGV